MLWWTLVLFLLVVFGLAFGVHGLSRFVGGAVGRSTLYTHRVAQMIYATGRIPRSWVSQELETSHPGAEAQAREEANRRIEKLITHFTRSPAFADETSRRELLRSLTTMRDRLQNEAIEGLVGPEPRLRRIVVFLDCGDTIADEGTEVKDADGVTRNARLIPGAARMVRRLKRRGHTLALVADGPRATFENVLKPRGLWRLFDAYAISGEVGALKPDARMFRTALDALDIPADERHNVVMVGNNLFRDIKGANDEGLTSVWLDWAPRRAKVPADSSEVPDHTIKKPLELLSLIERLEAEREGAHT